MYTPDIVVQGLDRPDFRLIVEVERQLCESAREQLIDEMSEYMHAMACPSALLVTTATTHLIELDDRAARQYEVTASMPTRALFGMDVSGLDQWGLVQLVFRWLESLAPRFDTRTEPFQTFLMTLKPALENAEVAMSGRR